MGGRGASSGISEKGKAYGSEYRTLLKDGNVKFVKYLDSNSAKTPQETMTKGRVYATVNSVGEITAITYYDAQNRRTKQIDLIKPHAGFSPHTHHGYEHNENDSAKGFANLTTEEKKMVAFVKKAWYNRLGK